MLTTLIWIVIVGIIWYATSYVPLPEPIPTFIKIVAIVIVLILVIELLLGFASSGFVLR